MSQSGKRLRQTTLFENFVSSKRGKILDLMETDMETKPEIRDILAAAAERRLLSHGANENESEVAPEIVDMQSCSIAEIEDSSTENLSLTFSQMSEDLFPVEDCNSESSSGNSDTVKASSSRNQISEKQLKRLPECHPSLSPSLKSSDAHTVMSKISEKQLKRLPDCCPSLPPLKSSDAHTVMFKLPIQNDVCPEPSPYFYHDLWDSSHVKMPCSRENQCPVLLNGEKTIESRWELIEKSLLQDITSSYDLQEAILQYNSQYANWWDFRGLHAFFKDVLEPEEREQFFKHTLPGMIRLTLQLPQICTHPIPLLRQKSNHAITFTQKQVACLLANAFFCTFPRRNVARRRSDQKLNNEYANYPDINFNRLYIGTSKGIHSVRAEKLKCLLNYFARVTSKEPTGTVTFRRQYLHHFPEWESSEKDVTNVVINSDGVIEVEGYGMLQVDFANKFVGGGVLGTGCVQEEIRFVICPELLVSRLFTECLGVSDVLVVTGVEQFNEYSGYADSFVWAGDFQDHNPRDIWGRRCTEVVAMDALHFHNSKDQYRSALMHRELHKAFCGFSDPDTAAECLPAVATGNWGCGVFKGNPHLKFLLQLMAVSEISRDMLYFTFKNPKLEKEIEHMYDLILKNNVQVGDIWAILRQYGAVVLGSQKATPPPAFYDYFCGGFSVENGDNESSQGSLLHVASNGSTKSGGNSDESTEELTDTEPVSRNEPG